VGRRQGRVEPGQARRLVRGKATVFADGTAVFLDDPRNADRFIVVGMSAAPRVLFVVHVIRGERERIISARPATASEERYYVPEP
jgi:uncharacterized DUF497 family protein